MTFAIVDDSADDREALKKHLLPYLTQNHFSAEITEFENAEEFLSLPVKRPSLSYF